MNRRKLILFGHRGIPDVFYSEHRYDKSIKFGMDRANTLIGTGLLHLLRPALGRRDLKSLYFDFVCELIAADPWGLTLGLPNFKLFLVVFLRRYQFDSLPDCPFYSFSKMIHFFRVDGTARDHSLESDSRIEHSFYLFFYQFRPFSDEGYSSMVIIKFSNLLDALLEDYETDTFDVVLGCRQDLLQTAFLLQFEFVSQQQRLILELVSRQRGNEEDRLGLSHEIEVGLHKGFPFCQFYQLYLGLHLQPTLYFIHLSPVLRASCEIQQDHHESGFFQGIAFEGRFWGVFRDASEPHHLHRFHFGQIIQSRQ